MSNYRLLFKIWLSILLLLHDLRAIYATGSSLYIKNWENGNVTCAETVFTVTRRNAMQCARLCASNGECCSFYFSEGSGVCTGCPFKYSIPSWTRNTHYSPGNTYFSTVRGKNGEICDFYEFNGHLYQFNKEPETMKNASIRCSHLGGHLVYVESELENSFLENVSSILPGLSDKKFWIGVSLDPEIDDGKWRWENGIKTEDSYEGFGNRQPSGNGKCVVMGYGRGVWDDQSCFHLNKYICEIE